MNTDNLTTETENHARAWFGSEARARLMDRAMDARQQVVAFVENNPLAAVGAATAIGFLFARLLRR